MRSNPMRGIVFGALCGLMIWMTGCVAWKRAYVAIHDAADEALTNKNSVVVAPATLITPLHADAYNYGTPSDGGHQFEVWNHNWHGMNIRVHANPGEFKQYGIPAVGKWYPINMGKMADGIVAMTKTATGATFTARDFVSPSGQRYRFEGFRADGLGTMSKVYTLELTDAQMGGALMVWFSTVK